MSERTATVTRNTLESQITISVNLDGTGKANLDTPVPFLNHMPVSYTHLTLPTT